MTVLAVQIVIVAVGILTAVVTRSGVARIRHCAAAGIFASCVAVLGYAVFAPDTVVYSLTVNPAVIGAVIAIMVVTMLVIAAITGFLSARAHLTLAQAYAEIEPEKRQQQRPAWRIWTLRILSIAFLIGAAVLIGVIVHGVRYIGSLFGALEADQVLFFLQMQNPGATPMMIDGTINRMIYPIIAGVGAVLSGSILVLDWFTVAHQLRPAFTRRRAKHCIAAVMAVLLVASLGYGMYKIPVAQIVARAFETSTFIEDNYVAPSPSVVKFPEKKRNLIHIYLESMENSYYSTDEGGYQSSDLMPDLAQLTRENVSFSHTDHFGGPHQTVGANHSVAGMLNFHAGVPMLPLFRHSPIGTISYPDFTTIGDILEAEGYHNEFMVGSDSSWHDLGAYYRQHGNFDVFDITTAKERGLVPPNYHVWWGIEDDKLYEYAKDELTKLGNADQPFYFILENADTHAPGGYVSPKMTERPYGQQYANVIHYSQKQTVVLVRWIQQQPWYKDTTIILTGDHRTMDTTFVDGWDPAYERTIVNVFVNGAQPDPGPECTHNRDYAPFDYFPTILASIGATIEGDRLGLGTNLYSGTPTLLERYGIGHVQEELNKRSPFFEEHRAEDLKRDDWNTPR